MSHNQCLFLTLYWQELMESLTYLLRWRNENLPSNTWVFSNMPAQTREG